MIEEYAQRVLSRFLKALSTTGNRLRLEESEVISTDHLEVLANEILN